MKLTIDRARWLRGTGSGLLLDGSGLMCCLGFLGQACGIKGSDMLGNATPSALAWRVEATRNEKVWATMPQDIAPRTVLPGEELAATAEDVFMLINDSTKIRDDLRERLLTEEFAKIGVEVEFVGEDRK